MTVVGCRADYGKSAVQNIEGRLKTLCFQLRQHDTTIVFHSGTKLVGEEYVTNGGRVLGVVGLGKDLRTALDRAYGRIEHIDFEGMQYRTDIGAKAFK